MIIQFRSTPVSFLNDERLMVWAALESADNFRESRARECFENGGFDEGDKHLAVQKDIRRLMEKFCAGELTIDIDIVESCMISNALLEKAESHRLCAFEHLDKACTVGDSHWVEADRHKGLIKEVIKLMEKVAHANRANPVY